MRATCLQDVFQAAGVTVPVHIIPEPVDVEFFSPADVEPLPLPAGQLVFGQRLADGQPHTKLLSVSLTSSFETNTSVQQHLLKATIHAGKPMYRPSSNGVDVLHVLQIFKWEERKAWDVLLAAYLEEFAAVTASGVPGADGLVALYLLTQPYHSSSDFASKMHTWAHNVLRIAGERQPLVRCPAAPDSMQLITCQLQVTQNAKGSAVPSKIHPAT